MCKSAFDGAPGLLSRRQNTVQPGVLAPGKPRKDLRPELGDRLSVTSTRKFYAARKMTFQDRPRVGLIAWLLPLKGLIAFGINSWG